MAVKSFVKQMFNGEGDLYKVENLVTGDESSVLKFMTGQVDITVQVYGTVGGSTVTVQGTLVGVQYGVCDDAYGSAMSYTAISGIPKPVGPAVVALKIVVTAGAGVDVDVDVYVVRKVRP